ncbi:MAG: hypothetical protein N0E56_15785 [Candidatus Thiodiazotropha endolucinida]|nr:hypothetical protein [Candidatus Thiodiazotropha taylori]MCW4268084.1 hypothetical protein [Candidatus Thiodiazotropha endolucinida]
MTCKDKKKTDWKPTTFHEIAKQKGWSLAEIGERWGIGERQMSRIANKPKQLHIDAARGLPEKTEQR